MSLRNIVSVSGGKDSVATWLWAKRTGLNPVAVYQDTRWEHPDHYKHLDLLEARIGPIIRIQAERGYPELVRHKGTFSSRVRKWCTEELKLKPFRAWLDAYRDANSCDVHVLLGIRWDESEKRESAVEREWSDFYDCEVWRPILAWTVEDVIAEHRRAAIPMHPLYHAGANRVGCWPCVEAGKEELALVAELTPERVDEIRAIEAEIGQTMFTEDRRTQKRRLERAGVEDPGPSLVPAGIDKVMEWARTSYGGKQFQLFRNPSGCARWGVCEKPPKGEP